MSGYRGRPEFVERLSAAGPGADLVTLSAERQRLTHSGSRHWLLNYLIRH